MLDITFISQYVQEQWNKEKNKLNKEKIELNKNIKNELNLSKKQELINKKERIINLENKINQYFQDLEKVKELNKVNIKSNNYIDEFKYREQLLELKKAILIMGKLRNSFEHQNDKLIIDQVVAIDNEKNKFKISIPIEYLDGFNKGRIIVKENDKYIIEKTYSILYPLLKELDYDPQKITSFFYNLEPNYLSFLLEIFNYDIKQIYKLPVRAFSYKEETKK